MSTDALAHWVAGGDPADARKYGLTLKGKCGAIFTVAKRMKLSDKLPCPACEALDGPIPGAKGNEAVGLNGRNASPHYVYRCYDATDALLYVGCTVDLVTRRVAHNTNSWWFPKVDHWRITVYPNKLHARRVETAAIADEQPLCNVRGQNFKAWPSSRLSLAHDLAVEMSATDFAARLVRAGSTR